MANQSISNAFERFWAHVTNALSTKSNVGHTHDDRYTTTTDLENALSEKSDTGHKHAATDITSGTLSSDRLPVVPIAKGGTGASTAENALTNLGITATAAELNKLDGVTATTAEINYLDGVESNIQTQLDEKSSVKIVRW